MLITLCIAKLHCVRVTDANLNYQGSITIDSYLMKKAGIRPFQMLHINNKTNAVHWETYAIPGKAKSGVICLNGGPARLYQPGDEVIIMALADMTHEEADTLKQTVVHVNEKNKITRIEIKKPSDF